MNLRPAMLLLTMAIVAGEDAAALRRAEAAQRVAVDAAAAAARRAAGIAEELRCNRLADPAAVDRGSEALAGLAAGPMTAILDRLGRGTPADLAAAAELQRTVLARLEELAAGLRVDAAQVDAAGVLAGQRRLRDATAALADRAIGRGADELAAAERVEVALLSQRQRALAGDLAALAVAGGLSELAVSAAEALAEVRLAAALEAQERILDALAGAAKAQGRPADPTSLDEQRSRLRRAEERQQRNLDQVTKTTGPAPAEWQALREVQRSIAQELAESGEDAAEAQRAEAALARQDRAAAQAAMQEALQGLQAARGRIEGRMAAGLQTAGGFGSTTPTAAGARTLPGGAAWRLDLDPAQREVAQQAAAERFPEAYAAALQDYYRALAGVRP